MGKRITAGEWVVDLRDRTAYAADHVAGTIGIGLGTQFATWLGWMIPWGNPLTLIGQTRQQVSDAQRELIRIGIDHLAGAAVGEPTDRADRRSYPVASFADLPHRDPGMHGGVEAGAAVVHRGAGRRAVGAAGRVRGQAVATGHAGHVAVALGGAWVSGRLLNVRGDTQIVIGVGTGISGASAIAATTAVTKAKNCEVAYAIGTIFTFNIAAVLLFPPIGHLLGMSPRSPSSRLAGKRRVSASAPCPSARSCRPSSSGLSSPPAWTASG